MYPQRRKTQSNLSFGARNRILQAYHLAHENHSEIFTKRKSAEETDQIDLCLYKNKEIVTFFFSLAHFFFCGVCLHEVLAVKLIRLAVIITSRAIGVVICLRFYRECQKSDKKIFAFDQDRQFQ